MSTSEAQIEARFLELTAMLQTQEGRARILTPFRRVTADDKIVRKGSEAVQTIMRAEFGNDYKCPF